MYVCSRLLLRQGFPGTVTELDTAAVSAVTRSRSAARHQRPARQALESSDRDADREEQEGPEAPGDGGCRRGRGAATGLKGLTQSVEIKFLVRHRRVEGLAYEEQQRCKLWFPFWLVCYVVTR